MNALKFFSENRKKVANDLQKGSVALLFSNYTYPSSGDQAFPFKQNADLYYLSGIRQEKTILLLFPDAPNEAFREVLFIRKPNEHLLIWEGYKLSLEDAKQISGVQNVMWSEDFESILPTILHYADNVYLSMNENDRADCEVEEANLFEARKIKKKFATHNYCRLAPIITKHRMRKSAYEVEQIKQAIDLTGKAFVRILETARPGMKEYELEAEIIHEFRRNGSQGHAFSPIMASGKNACVLHYVENDAELKKDDLVLLDFGAEYNQYNADMTRCFPVGGKFSERQKQVYNSVLDVMKEATKMLVCGNVLEEYHKEVGKLMEQELIKLKLLDATDVKNQDPARPLYKKYFMHGASHHLGLDVHDVGNRYLPFQEGNVFTCEPGIYIPEEGLGVRLENDILITKEGNIDLMKKVPVEIDEIESIMNAGK